MNSRKLTAAIVFVLISVLSGRTAVAEILTLDGAFQLALGGSPATVMAKAQVDEARAKTKQAESAFFPHLRIASSYYSSDNPVQVFMFGLNQGKFSLGGDLNNPERADNWQLSAQLGWRLFSGGADLANRKAARNAELAQKHMSIATINETTILVLRAYLDILVAKQTLKSSESAVAAFRSSEQVVSSRVGVGAALITDQLDIQVQRNQSEERRLRAEGDLVIAIEKLRVLLGLEEFNYDGFETIDDLDYRPPTREQSNQRPEVSAQYAFAEAAKGELSAVKAQYFPNIELFAFADRYQGWKFDGDRSDWTVGINASWPLFDGFMVRSQVKEKRALLSRANEAARATRLQSSLQLASARIALEIAEKRVAVMSEAAELASRSALISRQRFEQGLVLTSTLVDAENAVVQAETGLAAAKADRLTALAELQRAMNMSILGVTND